MKNGKQQSFSQSKGKAPNEAAHANRATPGFSGKHGISMKDGKIGDNKIKACAEQKGC